ncbi:4Fe-4S dicluster domain-containing protein [candidate division WOR-3 bacterium]|uniref:4Fe-4S dicluster domain-containing protein n=1 Tax=candidate division WOR-3 bacterium TaxID=2052148 RepID=A0A937XFC6_UNCW3|nr:4Fe-4S dicluster domain-containing protein [candidate division WOR-3 bacterium]
MTRILGRRTFGGGLRFRHYAGQPQADVETPGLPRRVVIPMLQGYGVPLEPLVKPGERVFAGQVIGRDDATVSSPVHATISGTVAQITRVTVRGREVAAAIIDGDGTDAWTRLDGASPDWQSLGPETIEDLLYRSGVTGLAREGIPTRYRSAVIGPESVRHVIVTLVGADVFKPNPAVLLGESELPGFATGLAILGRVLPNAGFHVAVSDEASVLVRSLTRALAGNPKTTIHALEPRYPQEFTEMLVRSVLKEDFPFGFAAANIGVVVADVQAVLAARDAVVEGRPVIERLVALAGPGFRKPGYRRVRIGSSFEQVVAGRLKSGDLMQKIVLDSILSGQAIDDLTRPIDRTATMAIAVPDDNRRLPFAFARPGLHSESFSRSFVPAWLPVKKAANTNRHGEERPCIQCGWCARACPVRIIPQLIYRQSRRNIDETLVRYGAFNCIDCNLCTLVCPSKIPLARRIADARTQLVEVGCDNSSCVVPRFDLKGIEEYKGVKSIR